MRLRWVGVGLVEQVVAIQLLRGHPLQAGRDRQVKWLVDEPGQHAAIAVSSSTPKQTASHVQTSKSLMRAAAS